MSYIPGGGGGSFSTELTAIPDGTTLNTYLTSNTSYLLEAGTTVYIDGTTTADISAVDDIFIQGDGGTIVIQNVKSILGGDWTFRGVKFEVDPASFPAVSAVDPLPLVAFHGSYTTFEDCVIEATSSLASGAYYIFGGDNGVSGSPAYYGAISMKNITYIPQEDPRLGFLFTGDGWKSTYYTPEIGFTNIIEIINFTVDDINFTGSSFDYSIDQIMLLALSSRFTSVNLKNISCNTSIIKSASYSDHKAQSISLVDSWVGFTGAIKSYVDNIVNISFRASILEGTTISNLDCPKIVFDFCEGYGGSVFKDSTCGTLELSVVADLKIINITCNIFKTYGSVFSGYLERCNINGLYIKEWQIDQTANFNNCSIKNFNTESIVYGGTSFINSDSTSWEKCYFNGDFKTHASGYLRKNSWKSVEVTGSFIAIGYLRENSFSDCHIDTLLFDHNNMYSSENTFIKCFIDTISYNMTATTSAYCSYFIFDRCSIRMHVITLTGSGGNEYVSNITYKNCEFRDFFVLEQSAFNFIDCTFLDGFQILASSLGTSSTVKSILLSGGIVYGPLLISSLASGGTNTIVSNINIKNIINKTRSSVAELILRVDEGGLGSEAYIERVIISKSRFEEDVSFDSTTNSVGGIASIRYNIINNNYFMKAVSYLFAEGLGTETIDENNWGENHLSSVIVLHRGGASDEDHNNVVY